MALTCGSQSRRFPANGVGRNRDLQQAIIRAVLDFVIKFLAAWASARRFASQKCPAKCPKKSVNVTFIGRRWAITFDPRRRIWTAALGITIVVTVKCAKAEVGKAKKGDAGNVSFD